MKAHIRPRSPKRSKIVHFSTTPQNGFGRIRHSPSDTKRISDAGRGAGFRALSGAADYRFDADRQACANAIGDATLAHDALVAATKSIRAHTAVADAVNALDHSIASLQPNPKDIAEPKGIVASRKPIIAYFEKWSAVKDRLASELEQAVEALSRIDTERMSVEKDRAHAGRLLTRADEVLLYVKAMDDFIASGIETLSVTDRNDVVNSVLNPLRSSAASLLEVMSKAVSAYEELETTLVQVESTREPTLALGKACFIAARAAAGSGPSLTKKPFRLQALIGDETPPQVGAADLSAALAAASEAAKSAKAIIASVTSNRGGRGVAA